jgi:3-oxoacyl-[acyl-carrier protein] reductase
MAISIDLSGKTALITGATGELGRVMARTLASCGADIALHYHQNAPKAKSLQQELEAMHVRALPVQGDITRQSSVEKMRDLIHRKLAPPDIVVACAVSRIDPWSMILDESAADFEDQFRSCVLQNLFLAKAFIPAMISRNYGRYIGINTECSMQMLPSQAAYASAKRGMDGLLRVLAREVGAHQITVNQVAPGWTLSEKDAGTAPDAHPAYTKSVPLKRRGTDQEIANTVAFLASDLASFISGAFIPVCGGNVMPTI